MTKNARRVLFGACIISVVAGTFFGIFLTVGNESASAASFGVGSPGCDITGGAGPDYYNSSGGKYGTSGVLTRSRNMTTGSGFSELTYAKPDDQIEVDNCYFPGEQRLIKNGAMYTIGHDHPTIFNSEPTTTTFHVENTTLRDRTEAEMLSHYTFIDAMDHQSRLNDGPYSFIPNYSRVTNMAGYYGGHGSSLGDDTIRHTTNGWKVGVTNTQFGTINWHVGTVGGNFGETQKLVFNNVATVNTDEPAGYTWTVPWTHTVPQEVPESEKVNVDGCYHTTTARKCSVSIKTYCQYAGNDDAECSCSGGYMKTTTTRVPNPGKCTINVSKTDYYRCTHDNPVYSFHTSRNEAAATSSTRVVLPYNYRISADMNASDSKPVYAGEKTSVASATVSINTKYNSVTKGDYATGVPYIKAQYITFLASDPEGNNKLTAINYGDEKEVTNTTGSPTPLEPSQWTYTVPGVANVNVYDTNAGNYFCVALRYYPTSSGSDTNINNVYGDGAWGISAPSCRIIAKRPSFQVWGGGIFSSGAIDVSRTVKTNLQGNTERPYKVTMSSDGNVFGSWAELGVTALGKNGGSSDKGMASASATAGMWGRYESTTSTGLCRYESMLSFANFSKSAALAFCNGATNLNANGHFGLGAPAMSKNTLIDDIWDYTENPIADGDVLNFIVGAPSTYKEYMNANGKLVRYSYVSGNIGISSGTANPIKVEQGFTGDGKKSTTYIVRSDKNVKIYNNIEYPDTYQTLNDIPKVVVYAKGNIDIWCGVTRIDAILIAEGTINTCNDDGNASVSRNVQLKINGALIADRLLLNRTYGAGPGAASGVPAEIINYDTSMLLWGQSQADISASGKMNATYTRELAPRY